MNDCSISSWPPPSCGPCKAKNPTLREVSSRPTSNAFREDSISRLVKTYGEVMADRAAVGVAWTGLKIVWEDGNFIALSEGIDMDDRGGMALNSRIGKAVVSTSIHGSHHHKTHSE